MVKLDSKFTSKLAPVAAGQLITVYGKSLSSAKFFDIQLTEAGDDNYCEEIPFHLSVRFLENGEIVRNSRTKSGKWGKEQRKENLVAGNVVNPVKCGAAFKIAILIDVDMFYVSIDDKPFCTFNHRKNLNRIKRFNVLSDIEQVYQFHHTTTQPIKSPAIDDSTFRLSNSKQFKSGDIIVIRATNLGSKTGGFVLNIHDEELKLFHMKADLKANTILINSQTDAYNWQKGSAIKPKTFPFAIGQLFRIAIVMKHREFLFAVDGDILGSVQLAAEAANKAFARISGLEIISKNDTKLKVHCFEFHEAEKDCTDFECYFADVI